MIKTVIFIDLESQWEVPLRSPYHAEQSLENILSVLANHKVKAVFNACGAVVEHLQNSIRKISEDGHEIALHGYRHENFSQLSRKELNTVFDISEKAILNACGKKPLGLRSPWLYKDENLYDILKERLYKWASNDHMNHIERFQAPALREQFKIFGSSLPAKLAAHLSCMRFPRQPYLKDGITEIPLLSSMDGELLDLISPSQDSPEEWIDFALNAWLKQLSRAKGYFNLNLHDWLIGTGNRLGLFGNILEELGKRDAEFVLARDLL